MAPIRKRQKLDQQGTNSQEVQNIPNEETASLSHEKSESQQQTKDPRTLFVRLLHANTTTEDLILHFSQSYPIKHAVAVLDPISKACKGYGFVTFADPEDATLAIEELDNTELLGRKIKVELAQARNRGDEAKYGITVEKKKVYQEEIRPSPKLIVRNLPWSINTSEKLAQLFLSFGKIKEAILPKNSQGRLRGFGIVIVRGQKNSEKALEGLNGKVVDGRTLAVDWAADKETWAKFKAAEAEAESQTTATKENGNVVEDTMDMDDASESDADIISNEDFDEDVMDLDNEDHEEDDYEEDDEDENDVIVKPQINRNNSTIFIRNLPFSCTDETLQDHFSQFGPIRYSRVVFDQVTEMSKGTGFVCFFNETDADSCIREAPISSSSQNDAQSHSILQDHAADPSGRYTLDGRVLIIARAVNRDEANKLQQIGIDRRSKRANTDKRRLYLLNEGRVTSSSPLFGKIPPAEQILRDKSYRQRKTLVEKNPSLHLSLTRLAVRNIPRWLTSKDFKALARKAIVEFATEVKEKTRQQLSKEELARGGDEMRLAEQNRKKAGKGVVKQAKIVFETRQGSKIVAGKKNQSESAETVAGRSRGHGFIEYHTHRSALMGLRWLNGHRINPAEIGLEKDGGKKNMANEDKNKRLIVEFALENANVIKRRDERERKSRTDRHVADMDEEDQSKNQGQEEDSSPINQQKAKMNKKNKKQLGKARGGVGRREEKNAPMEASDIRGADTASKSTKQIILRKRMARRAKTRIGKAG